MGRLVARGLLLRDLERVLRSHCWRLLRLRVLRRRCESLPLCDLVLELDTLARDIT